MTTSATLEQQQQYTSLSRETFELESGPDLSSSHEMEFYSSHDAKMVGK